MISVKEAYNHWADQYDTNKNRTRDLEALSLRETLADLHVEHILEIGCGTGKNTEWLQTIATQLSAVDLSEEMLAKAKSKISAPHVQFLQADILQDWTFATQAYDLVTFSLILEHIEHLDPIFQKLAPICQPGGHVYIGELHPFKQYSGTKARFETETGVQIVPCFDHHISDFTMAAKRNGFGIVTVQEYFDENDRSTIPRILTILLKKI
ncbi:MAG: class I SAM-dependent methyltransferase [Saprospiraceae bacterium]|nr:class I SAM-dependent methyltransferase [Saprospiraceae bacterium]